MCPIEESLWSDPQQQKSLPCPVCHKETYAPSYYCCRCERRSL